MALPMKYWHWITIVVVFVAGVVVLLVSYRTSTSSAAQPAVGGGIDAAIATTKSTAVLLPGIVRTWP